jgi:hypothetical protein
MGFSTAYLLFLIQEWSNGPRSHHRSQLSPKIWLLLFHIVAKLSNSHYTSFPVLRWQEPWDPTFAHSTDFQLVVQNFFNTPCTNSYFLWQFKLAWISSPIFKTLSGLTEVLGRRAWGSFSTWCRPSRNDFTQLNTLGCDKHSSPNFAWNLVKISEGMTPFFVRNLIIIRCATLLGTACTAILIAPDG